MDHELIVADWDGTQDMDRSKDVADMLCKEYPGHPWIVNAQDGSVWISLLTSQPFGQYCYFINQKDVTSPTTLRELTIRGGGEFLERLGLPRHGKWDGSPPKHLEGADMRFFRGDML